MLSLHVSSPFPAVYTDPILWRQGCPQYNDVAGQDQKQDIVLESTVTVTSNRMLMGFIKTTLQESHETLVKEFVAVLEKELEKAA
jgi:hypothetical protein